MPKRIIDGEALYRSRKLLDVEPEKYRAEYANILPMALANGVCECNPRLVWANVYSYNRPSVTIKEVEKILDAIEKADLIRRWKHTDGKTYAYFPGIEKGGRLPPQSRVKRREYTCGPEPPDVIRTYCVPLCSGSGSGLGKDICANPPGSHDGVSSTQPLVTSEEYLAAIQRVWEYYLERLEKNPKLLTFTPQRKDKGLARLRECLLKTGDDLARAEGLMRVAVDALAASAFHRGENDRHKKYDSWERNLFASQEQLERWLEQA